MAIGAEAAQSAVKMTRLRTPSTINTADHLSQLVLGSQVLHLLLTGQYAFWLTTLGSQVLHLLLTGYLVAALPQILPNCLVQVEIKWQMGIGVSHAININGESHLYTQKEFRVQKEKTPLEGKFILHVFLKLDGVIMVLKRIQAL